MGWGFEYGIVCLPDPYFFTIKKTKRVMDKGYIRHEHGETGRLKKTQLYLFTKKWQPICFLNTFAASLIESEHPDSKIWETRIWILYQIKPIVLHSLNRSFYLSYIPQNNVFRTYFPIVYILKKCIYRAVAKWQKIASFFKLHHALKMIESELFHAITVFNLNTVFTISWVWLHMTTP